MVIRGFAALVAHDVTTFQDLLDRLSSSCKRFSLIISVKKIVLSPGLQNDHEPLKLDGSPLETGAVSAT